MRPHILDFVLGGILLAFATAMMLVVIPVGIDSPSEIPNPALSPILWPEIIMVMTGIFALLMVGRGFLRMRNPEGAIPADPVQDLVGSELQPEEPAVDPSMEWQGADGVRRTLIGCALLILLFPVLQTLGLLVGSILATIALALLYRDHRHVAMVGCAIGVPLICFLFFERVAGIPIPMGMLEGLFG